MKISKQRLKDVIKEELANMNEGFFAGRRLATATKNLESAQKAKKLVQQLMVQFNAAESREEKAEIRDQVQALVDAVSKISNISEELTAEGSREDMMMPAISMADMEAAMAADDAGLGDLQSDEKFTGGSREERLITLIRAREALAAMSKEELTALSKSLDAEQVAVLRHILANPMYAPTGGQGDEMELEEGFKSGEKVTHDEYGTGVVTHPGTKNTDVAVKFEKDTGRGKSIKVNRAALKKS